MKLMEGDIEPKWRLVLQKKFSIEVYEKNQFLDRPSLGIGDSDTILIPKKVDFAHVYPLPLYNLFLFLVVSRFLEFNLNLHRLSPTEFKFYLTIWSIQELQRVEFSRKFLQYLEEKRRCNFWTDAYF
jgi:hypothetical protein